MNRLVCQPCGWSGEYFVNKSIWDDETMRYTVPLTHRGACMRLDNNEDPFIVDTEIGVKLSLNNETNILGIHVSV